MAKKAGQPVCVPDSNTSGPGPQKHSPALARLHVQGKDVQLQVMNPLLREHQVRRSIRKQRREDFLPFSSSGSQKAKEGSTCDNNAKQAK